MACRPVNGWGIRVSGPGTAKGRPPAAMSVDSGFFSAVGAGRAGGTACAYRLNS